MSPFRSSRRSKAIPSSAPLLPTTQQHECDPSEYSDDSEDEKDGISLPLKSTFRVSQGPVTDSFPDSSYSQRRSCRHYFPRLSRLIPRLPKSRRSNSDARPYGSSVGVEQGYSQRPRLLRKLFCICVVILVMLGVVQLITLIGGIIAAFFPEDIHSIIGHWGEVGKTGAGLDHWPTDFTRDITPISCHSHNDYWRRVPLYSALSAGCIGVEADVWLFDEELYVGHSTSSLTLNRTLRNLYLNPLMDILENQNPTHRFHLNISSPVNGVFDVDPSQTLILLIDFKTSGPTTFPYVVSQLAPLRDRGYLTHFNGHTTVQGPITVVATGNAPFDSIIGNTTYRDIFFDAPLKEMSMAGTKWSNMDRLSDVEIDYRLKASEQMEDGEKKKPNLRRRFIPQDQGQGSSGHIKGLNPDVYSPQNSYYASVSLSKAVGHLWRRKLSSRQVELIRQQVRGAHRRGLKARYWNIPKWPIGLRNQIWETLIEEGVDILNVDDLRGAAIKDWKKWKGWLWQRRKDHTI